jgi:hypothetical protein
VGLIPAHGLGVGRRAVFLALLTWLPLAVWAVLNRRAFPGMVEEPLLQHFTVHVRSLVAIPLLILAERTANRVVSRLVPHFVNSGLVQGAERQRLREIVERLLRLRNASYPWAILLGVMLALTMVAPVVTEWHSVVWANEAPARPGFGGYWFLYVSRPVFIALMIAWAWRYALSVILLFRISRLDLQLVPSHPDRAGGLGFLESFPGAWSLVALAASAVVSSTWAHEAVYHGVSVQSLRFLMAGFLVLLVAIFSAPLLLFVPKLRQARRKAVLEYGALVAEHGRLVHRKWILREGVAEPPLLDAPELGPVADVNTLYEAVKNMRAAPLGKATLVSIAGPAALPILCVVAIEVPIRDLILKVLSALA